MKNTLRKITTTSTLALTATIVTGVTPPPASAQVIELLSIAGSALNSLTNGNQQQVPQQPQYQPPVQNPVNRNWTLGANNLNGNNFHFCLLPCAPQAPRPAIAPQSIPPQGIRPGTPIPPQGIPPQGIRPPVGAVPVQQNQQIIRNGVSIPPQGIRPGTPIPPQGIRPGTPVPPQAQPPAPRPTIVIPPIRLPINLPR